MHKAIHSERIPTPANPYSQAVLAEGRKLLFISGQTPVNAAGETVGADDFRAQAVQVFDNIQANLEAAGASWREVVKLNVFLLNMANFAVFNEVRKQYLQPDYPATSAVAVAGLVVPEWMIEVEAVAVLD
ncbi:MAG: RidA family protein [Armatimonadota bacterium]